HLDKFLARIWIWDDHGIVVRRPTRGWFGGANHTRMQLWTFVAILAGNEAFKRRWILRRNVARWLIVLIGVEPSQQVIERTVFHHHHDDVFDVVHSNWHECPFYAGAKVEDLAKN